MPTACLLGDACRVSLESERLVVRGRREGDSSQEDVILREIPLRDVARVIAEEGTRFSGDSLAALLRASIPVTWLAWNGECLDGFLPAEFPFERRSTRPPRNAVNACISYGATLLHQEMVAALHARGLDPALGLLHATENGRWSLALDLMEPFRPVLVEALALDLFSHQILGTPHFETRDGGVFLTRDGRRKFHLQYERRMDRQFLAELRGHRTTLRQELDRHATLFKAALDDPTAFEPFVMN